MAERPLRFALIGAGRWGRVYIETLKRLEGFELVRLASTNAQSRALVGDGCAISEDWQAVAGAADIDAVIIATPPALHAQMADVAIAAGNPVLIEKPLTQDLDEAAALLDFAEAQKAIVHVDHIHLCHPGFRELKSQGLGMGQIHALRSGAGNWGPFRPDASVLWDWGPHDVAMCLDLMGQMPQHISARLQESRHTDDGAGQSIALQLTFPGGVRADIELSNLLQKKKRFLAVHYDRENLIYDSVGPDALVREPRIDEHRCLPEQATVLDVAHTMALDQVLTDFAAAINKGEIDLSGLKLGYDVVAVLETCEKALKQSI
jgi:predicted dehydrogenase